MDITPQHVLIALSALLGLIGVVTIMNGLGGGAGLFVIIGFVQLCAAVLLFRRQPAGRGLALLLGIQLFVAAPIGYLLSRQVASKLAAVNEQGMMSLVGGPSVWNWFLCVFGLAMFIALMNGQIKALFMQQADSVRQETNYSRLRQILLYGEIGVVVVSLIVIINNSAGLLILPIIACYPPIAFATYARRHRWWLWLSVIPAASMLFLGFAILVLGGKIDFETSEIIALIICVCLLTVGNIALYRRREIWIHPPA